MWSFILPALIVALFYLVFLRPLNYWKKRNVPFSKSLPIFGNMFPVVCKRKSMVEVIQELYNAFPDNRYHGIFSFAKPQLMVKDPSLIRKITVKDFDHFTDRSNKITEDVEPIFAKNLTVLKGQQWKEVRAKMTPSFSTHKMKMIFNLVNDCALQFVNHFYNASNTQYEMKDVFSRFSNDAIASVAFGIEIDSMADKENDFFVMGKNINAVKGLRLLCFLGYYICPSLMKFFKIPFLPKTCSRFFSELIADNIKERRNKGIVRPDMVHMLLQSNADFKEAEANITAQAILFFFAGFETTSTVMSFLSCELALNTEVQRKLQKEIDQVCKDSGGRITYETLLKMRYLDMVVSEALRKWPPGLSIERICVKDYLITADKPNEELVLVKKGQSINIPVYALHHDHKYFPNPEKFDPERFAQRDRIVPFTYLPFGAGPRSCIASRFAVLEVKILFFQLLSKFELVPTERTPNPLVISRKKFVMAPDGGFFLDVKKRPQI